MTKTSKEVPEVILDRVSYIYYTMQFQKNKEIIKALINFESKVNRMTPVHTKQLGHQTSKTDVGA